MTSGIRAVMVVCIVLMADAGTLLGESKSDCRIVVQSHIVGSIQRCPS